MFPDDNGNSDLLKLARPSFRNELLSISVPPVDPLNMSRSKAWPAFVEPKAASPLAAFFVRWCSRGTGERNEYTKCALADALGLMTLEVQKGRLFLGKCQFVWVLLRR